MEFIARCLIGLLPIFLGNERRIAATANCVVPPYSILSDAGEQPAL